MTNKKIKKAPLFQIPSTNPSTPGHPVGPSPSIPTGREAAPTGTIGQKINRVDEATIKDVSLCVRGRFRNNLARGMIRSAALLEALKHCKGIKQ